jgi:hypothetical protein
MGSEKWAQATKDMLALNRQDRIHAPATNRPPYLSVGYESKGLEET